MYLGGPLVVSRLLLLTSVIAFFYQQSFAAACIALLCVQAMTGVTLHWQPSHYSPAFPHFFPRASVHCSTDRRLSLPEKSTRGPVKSLLDYRSRLYCAAVAVMAALIIRKRKELNYA